jgi:hypothetical protein
MLIQMFRQCLIHPGGLRKQKRLANSNRGLWLNPRKSEDLRTFLREIADDRDDGNSARGQSSVLCFRDNRGWVITGVLVGGILHRIVECLQANRFEVPTGADCEEVSALVSWIESSEQTRNNRLIQTCVKKKMP